MFFGGSDKVGQRFPFFFIDIELCTRSLMLPWTVEHNNNNMTYDILLFYYAAIKHYMKQNLYGGFNIIGCFLCSGQRKDLGHFWLRMLGHLQQPILVLSTWLKPGRFFWCLLIKTRYNSCCPAVVSTWLYSVRHQLWCPSDFGIERIWDIQILWNLPRLYS